VPIKAGEPRYLTPLLRDAQALAILAGEHCRVILLGSVASSRYVEPLLQVFGERLLFPPTFAGRGDMSRGGLLLRCAAAGFEPRAAPLISAVRHGSPRRLARRGRGQGRRFRVVRLAGRRPARGPALLACEQRVDLARRHDGSGCGGAAAGEERAGDCVALGSTQPWEHWRRAQAAHTERLQPAARSPGQASTLAAVGWRRPTHGC
jgi:hypothetical protein